MSEVEKEYRVGIHIANNKWYRSSYHYADNWGLHPNFSDRWSDHLISMIVGLILKHSKNRVRLLFIKDVYFMEENFIPEKNYLPPDNFYFNVEKK